MFKDYAVFAFIGLIVACVVGCGFHISRSYTRLMAGTPAMERRMDALEKELKALRNTDRAIIELVSNTVTTVQSQQGNINDISKLCAAMLRTSEISLLEKGDPK